MQMKIVVRLTNADVLKGTTANFSIDSPVFNLQPQSAGPMGKTIPIQMRNVKALFFVKDFTGNPAHVERMDFEPGQMRQGKRLQVTFNDGEVYVGSTMNYDPKAQGFFMVPADPSSNTIRAFVVVANTRSVELLD